jgi:PAS domain S-box-containing protein
LKIFNRYRQRDGGHRAGAIVFLVGGALVGLTIVIAGLVFDTRGGIVAGLAMIVPVLFSLHLLHERNRNIVQLKAREEKLLDLSRRFNLAMETANIGIWEVGEADDLLSWDARAAALHGFAPTEGCDRMTHWYKIIHPDDVQDVEAAFSARLHGDSTASWDISYRITLPDGMTRHLRSVGAHSNGGNGPRRLTGIVWDVTNDTLFNQALREAKATSDIKNAELELALDELSSREHELSELSHKLDVALASYNCGIWEGDPVTTTAYWDDRMHQLYNVPNRNRPVTRHEWLSALHQDDRQSVQLATNRAIASGTTVNTTQRILLPNNELRYVRSVGQVHMGKDGKKKIIGIAFDVTADALLAEQLRAAKADADSRNLELELAKNRSSSIPSRSADFAAIAASSTSNSTSSARGGRGHRVKFTISTRRPLQEIATRSAMPAMPCCPYHRRAFPQRATRRSGGAHRRRRIRHPRPKGRADRRDLGTVRTHHRRDEQADRLRGFFLPLRHLDRDRPGLRHRPRRAPYPRQCRHRALPGQGKGPELLRVLHPRPAGQHSVQEAHGRRDSDGP